MIYAIQHYRHPHNHRQNTWTITFDFISLLIPIHIYPYLSIISMIALFQWSLQLRPAGPEGRTASRRCREGREGEDEDVIPKDFPGSFINHPQVVYDWWNLLGLEHGCYLKIWIIFPLILGIVTPADFHIFQRGSNFKPEMVNYSVINYQYKTGYY